MTLKCGHLSISAHVDRIEDPELKPNELSESFKALEESVSKPQSL